LIQGLLASQVWRQVGGHRGVRRGALQQGAPGSDLVVGQGGEVVAMGKEVVGKVCIRVGDLGHGGAGAMLASREGGGYSGCCVLWMGIVIALLVGCWGVGRVVG
jgi:hypothetical protein